MPDEERYIEASPEPEYRRAFVPPRSLNDEQQTVWSDDEVWLKRTPQPPLRMDVLKTRVREHKRYVKLKDHGKDTLYEKGAWVAQKKVSLARAGPKNPNTK